MASSCSTFFLRWWSVLTDTVIIVILLALVIFLEEAPESGLYVERGFFCDDETLRYPFSKHPAVPSWLLVIGCVLIPVAAIVLGNVYERYYKKRTECVRKRITLSRGRSLTIPTWLLRTLFHLRWFFIGAGITVVLTDIGKVTVGRLRPHFFSVCRPDFSSLNCTDKFGNGLYITHYTCLGRDDIPDIEQEIHEAHLSFPSGHSSSSTYSFVFLLLYLTSVRTFYHRSGIKLILSLASLTLAILTSFSRLSDYRHHPTDVLAGMALGAVVAVIIVFYYLSFLGHHKRPTTNEDESLLAPLNSSSKRVVQHGVNVEAGNPVT